MNCKCFRTMHTLGNQNQFLIIVKRDVMFQNPSTAKIFGWQSLGWWMNWNDDSNQEVLGRKSWSWLLLFRALHKGAHTKQQNYQTRNWMACAILELYYHLEDLRWMGPWFNFCNSTTWSTPNITQTHWTTILSYSKWNTSYCNFTPHCLNSVFLRRQLAFLFSSRSSQKDPSTTVSTMTLTA